MLLDKKRTVNKQDKFMVSTEQITTVPFKCVSILTPICGYCYKLSVTLQSRCTLHVMIYGYNQPQSESIFNLF